MSREEQIQSQAKQIMDTFFDALDASGITDEEIGVSRSIQTRDAVVSDPDLELKQAILKNAPHKDQDNIIAEKKTW